MVQWKWWNDWKKFRHLKQTKSICNNQKCKMKKYFKENCCLKETHSYLFAVVIVTTKAKPNVAIILFFSLSLSTFFSLSLHTVLSLSLHTFLSLFLHSTFKFTLKKKERKEIGRSDRNGLKRKVLNRSFSSSSSLSSSSSSSDSRRDY